ncbi:MAG TPA: hypothetical protein VJL90_03725 [Pseudorhodoplanes sp.]|nr:hypothetical protein [Pseudorhodoplanes sp.]
MIDDPAHLFAGLRPGKGWRSHDSHHQDRHSDSHRPIAPSNEKMNVESNHGTPLLFQRD